MHLSKASQPSSNFSPYLQITVRSWIKLCERIRAGREAKVRQIAYKLWLRRSAKDVPGEPGSDYRQAEIFIARRTVNIGLWLVSSLWFVLSFFLIWHFQSSGRFDFQKAATGLDSPLVIIVQRKAGPPTPVNASPTPVLRSDLLKNESSPTPRNYVTLPVAGTEGISPGKYDERVEKRAYIWDRKEAIQFGLTQLSLRINGVLVTAGAVFWFAVKILVDQRKETLDYPMGLGRWEVLACWNVLMSCCVSILFGFLAISYFNDLPIRISIALDESIGPCMDYQILFFLLAVAFLLLTLGLGTSRSLSNENSHL
jgi:hypothetical protein